MKDKEQKSKSKIEKRIFLKPGENNREERINFIKFWANYIKTHEDEDWSEQQNVIIDAQIF